MNLDELKVKYPKDDIKHAPKADCKFCGGTGEARTKHPKYPTRPCICVYVDHSVAEQFQDALNEIGKQKKS